MTARVRDDEEEDFDDDWSPPVYLGGKARLMAEKCSTCIFRPGNLMSLNPGRVADMLADVRASDSYVPCHKALGVGLAAGAVCRGSDDAHRGQLMRIAERLGAIVEVTEEQILAEIEALHDSVALSNPEEVQ